MSLEVQRLHSFRTALTNTYFRIFIFELSKHKSSGLKDETRTFKTVHKATPTTFYTPNFNYWLFIALHNDSFYVRMLWCRMALWPSIIYRKKIIKHRGIHSKSITPHIITGIEANMNGVYSIRQVSRHLYFTCKFPSRVLSSKVALSFKIYKKHSVYILSFMPNLTYLTLILS